MKSPVNIRFLESYGGEAVAILRCGEGTVGIALSHARSLWMDSPVRKYPSLAKAGERVDDVLLRIRVEFNAHECQAQMFAQSTKSA